jgi:hypothetical protein
MLSEQPSVQFRVSSLTRIIPRPLPFKTYFAAMPNSEGLVAVQQLPDTGAVIVHRVMQSGAHTTVRLPLETRAVGPSDVTAVVKAIADGVQESLSRMRIDAVSHRVRDADIEDALQLPSRYPPVSGVAVDPDGALWLKREDVIGRESVVWQKYEVDGTGSAAIVVPAACQHVVMQSMSKLACAYFNDEVGWSIKLYAW